ncbi:promethin-like [Salarias fasciatus]|uniref:promethin-like n=1 Tax=Salarias fasciatus TaxID=181472 RepID=UPI001176D2BC|nr:promethin-like [Salarias fasciatus]XP_029945032.1 promethin-like [Salarias fasciatus]XP_029945033.1 promethin-like [Salarias fasciatus]
MQSSSRVQQLYGRWTALLNRLQEDPKVAQVMNSRIGQYLSSHPFVALSVMLFSAMAALPFGLFLSFALVTLIMAAVGFVFFEAFLLFVGGVTLLCVLSGIGVFSVVVAVFINVVYTTSSSLLSCYNTRQAERSQSEEKDGGDDTSAETQ